MAGAFRKGFRHKSIAAFRVDGYIADDSEPNGKRKVPFQFKDHQLIIDAESAEELDAKVDAFKHAVLGCHPSDRLQIVGLKVVENEEEITLESLTNTSVNTGAVRGALDTAAIPDSMAPNKAVPNPSPAQKLGLNVKQS